MTFLVKGDGEVHLTGYYDPMENSEDDEEDSEEEEGVPALV